MKAFVLEVPLRWGDMDANAAGVPHRALRAMASGKEWASVKEFVLEVPLRWGDMDANAAGVPHGAPRATASGKHQAG